MKKIALLVLATFNFHLFSHIHLVVFSYHRPMQLYALLESIQEKITGITSTHVIYRADTQDFESGYQLVKEQFPNVTYMRQSSTPQADFKALTLQAIDFNNSTEPYVIFAVDDIIVKNKVDLTDCIHSLEHTGAYAFYLRLGLNITQCYSERMYTGLPELVNIKHTGPEEVYVWDFTQGTGDWGYPNTVDMTLYRKRHIRKAFQQMEYTSPNTLEASWAACNTLNKHCLCYKLSKIVNIPLNLVQHDAKANRNMAMFSPEFLLQQFLQGQKIDTSPATYFYHTAPHTDYVVTFIPR